MARRLPTQPVQKPEPVRKPPTQVREEPIPSPEASKEKPKPDSYEDWVDKQW